MKRWYKLDVSYLNHVSLKHNRGSKLFLLYFNFNNIQAVIQSSYSVCMTINFCGVIIFTGVRRKTKKESAHLDSTIELLDKTSTLVKNFTRPLPYTSLEDERFMQNKEVLRWLEN